MFDFINGWLLISKHLNLILKIHPFIHQIHKLRFSIQYSTQNFKYAINNDAIFSRLVFFCKILSFLIIFEEEISVWDYKATHITKNGASQVATWLIMQHLTHQLDHCNHNLSSIINHYHYQMTMGRFHKPIYTLRWTFTP